MIGFTGLTPFRKKITGMTAGLLPVVGDLMFESIVEGSAITGAPGQPFKKGDLKASWKKQLSADRVSVFSDSEHAIPNEYGVRKGGGPYIQHSSVGGRHSVGLTRMNFQKIVDVAAVIVNDRAGAAGDAA